MTLPWQFVACDCFIHSTPGPLRLVHYCRKMMAVSHMPIHRIYERPLDRRSSHTTPLTMHAFFDAITHTSAGQDKFLKVVQNVIRLLLSASQSWRYRCRLHWLDKSCFMRLRAEISVAVKLTRVYAVPGHLQQMADAICRKEQPTLNRILRVVKALAYIIFAIGDGVGYLSTISFPIPSTWKPKIARASVHALLLATICQFLQVVISSTTNIKITYQRLKSKDVARLSIAKKQELRTYLPLLSASCDMVSAIAGAGYREVNDATLGILGSLSGGSGLTLIVAK